MSSLPMISECSAKKMEQEEIIEHYVTESRRVCGNGGLRGTMKEVVSETIERRFNEEFPFSDFCRTSQNSLLGASSAEAERRYNATGERDCSNDTFFIQTAGDQPLSSNQSRKYFKSSENLDHSTTNIDSYGYDVHEVHTSEGGARIVQTHGTGLICGNESPENQMGRSLKQQRIIHEDRGLEQSQTTLIRDRRSSDRCPGNFTALKSAPKEMGFLGSLRSTVNTAGTSVDQHRQTIYSLSSPFTAKTEAWRQVGAIQPDSMLSRKDSYKCMQMGQQDDHNDIYAPRSDASLMAGLNRSQSESSEQLLTLWEQIVQYFRKLISRYRNTKWTPRLICLLLFFLLLTTLFFILLSTIISAIFGSLSIRTLSLYPPACEECRRHSPDGAYTRIPSTLHIHFYSSSQVHLELIGNPPFRSNSFTAIDFDKGFIAIADHSLIDNSGRHTTCFLMPLDRSAIPSISALRDALSSVSSEVYSEYGWQEYWQYQTEAIDLSDVKPKFTDEIENCRYAKWYFLKHTVYTRDSSCSTCYDFCLPDYAIQRLHKYEDDMTIGIRRLDCFRLYVPEWANYQVAADNQGGHWSYPRIPLHTQKDFPETRLVGVQGSR